MLVLGIESSCDETAAALVQDGHTVLSNIVASQIDTHRSFGGVVPELASREHLRNIGYVVRRAFEEARASGLRATDESSLVLAAAREVLDGRCLAVIATSRLYLDRTPRRAALRKR